MSAYIRGQMFRPIGVAGGGPERPSDESNDSGRQRPKTELEAKIRTYKSDLVVDYEEEDDEEQEDSEEAIDELDEEEEENADLVVDLPYDGQPETEESGQNQPEIEDDEEYDEDDEELDEDDEYDSITAQRESTLRPVTVADSRARLVDVRPKVLVMHAPATPATLAIDEDYDLEDEDEEQEEEEEQQEEEIRAPPRRDKIQASIQLQKPAARSPKLETKMPKPDTRSPKPETKLPKSETRSPKPEMKLDLKLPAPIIKAGSVSPRLIKASSASSLGSPKTTPPFRPEIPASWTKDIKFGSRPELSPSKSDLKIYRPPDIAPLKPEIKLSRQEVMGSARPLAFTRPAVVAKPEIPQPVPVPTPLPEVVASPTDSYLSYLSLPAELARDALDSARQVWREVRQLVCGEAGDALEQQEAEVSSWRPNVHFRRAAFHYASLLMATYVYLFAGAFLFKLLEGFFEVRTKCDVQRHRHDLIEDLWNRSALLDFDDWKRAARDHLREFEATVHRAHQQGVTGYSGTQTWSLDGSLVYAATILTTIGYGHIVPSTTAGRVATMLYAVIGIPLLLMVLADFGKLLTRAIKCLHAFVVRFYHTGSCRKLRRTRPVQAVTKLMFSRSPNGGASHDNAGKGAEDGALYEHGEHAHPEEGEADVTPEYPVIDDEFDLPAWITILLLVAYILSGACMFIQWEKHWSYFEAVYFVFISMSTIGFGDFVPEHPIFMMGTFVYLLFGLALTSMCINVIQESLTTSFRQASIKLSARMGLEMTEAPSTQAAEIAPVHYPAKRKDQ